MTKLTRINPSIPIVIALMALTALLRLINVAGFPTRLDDEGTYVAQAFAVTQWGELAHYTYWYDHPPAGWLQLALWMTITGPGFGENAVVAGRYLMVLVAVLTAGLLWLLARRVGLSRWAAAAAVTITAVSPLAIALSRSVYLDNLAVAWVLGGLVLLFTPRHRLSAMFGAAICFGVAVLTKETMLLMAPMVAWLVWIKTAPATRRYALAVFTAVFGLVVSTYVLMAVVRGELIPGPGHVSLWEGIKFQLWQREAGGTLGDPGSLKRHTIDEWLQLDPVLPLLAAPIGLAALLIERLRPFAVGLLTLVVMVVRPGYLPVPFVIAVVPLTALLAAGLGEEALARLRRTAEPHTARKLRTRRAAALSTAFAASVIVALWQPSYHQVLTNNDDASLRQAQRWISENVPKKDRLIVDDALWVDLVRDGRARQNVIWSYKVDTDEQVQNWAPKGWADYDWVVSTASMRANMPKTGVLTDAMNQSRPVASFGTGGKKVDVLRVASGASSANPAPPAVPAFGGQVAARMDPSSDPDALAALQSRTVDQRVTATLAVLAAMQPVVLENIAAQSQEELVGTPRREFTLSGPPDRLQIFATFLERQQDPFAVESTRMLNDQLIVRFPSRAIDIGLGDDPGAVSDGTAALRVMDMRRPTPAENLELVRLDGTSAGSFPLHGNANPADHRTLPAGTYVVTTVAERGGAARLRQAFTIKPGASYTLALFSAAESSEVAAQLAPDGPPAGSPPPAVRLLHAAGAVGSVKLTLNAAGREPTMLADNASYGLITGYAPQPAGAYDAVITANGREWHLPVELADGQPTTLVLIDGQDGPTLLPMSDTPGVAAPLAPPSLASPTAAPITEKAPAQSVTAEDPRQQVIPVALCAVVISMAAAAAVRIRRRQHR
ncbi:MAG: glycosyltransferase family 39 protein [Mycobacteriaceae bacterium]|nr:glycosyltransferase family 39 protein [Mycobacteriaceae bacterium]